MPYPDASGSDTTMLSKDLIVRYPSERQPDQIILAGRSAGRAKKIKNLLYVDRINYR